MPQCSSMAPTLQCKRPGFDPWVGTRGWPASRHHQGAQHLLRVPWTQFREPGEVRARGW